MGKVCTKCKVEKPVTDFYKSPRAKDGLRFQCIPCHHTYGKDPEQRKIWSKTYHKKRKVTNPALFLWKQAKHRCKFDGKEREFSITVEDIVIPEFCPYLGIKLSTENKWTSPSLDRIDSSLGYTKGNIQVISTRANIMKSNCTTQELVAFAKGVLAVHLKEGQIDDIEG